ncbi:SDR family NAD(P)-dependent oxidoreductase [Fodinicola feengrottensis]|uniref:SDR family NAD(P)-dependent oxidoreductase n=1 Tax=Fodinicola feengrottensis TaxID=435914 RepID=UPI0024423C7D|nr:SDR family NAD(P)-dependent oxidoreductase [Fodinicola feengrottensis]
MSDEFDSMMAGALTGADFAGTAAIVTGGASGIGLATAVLLASRGAQVACLDLSDEVPEPLLGLKCDVRDDAAVRAAVALAVQRFGRLDVVVANAGIGAQGTVEDNSDDEWHRVFDVNVLGVARTVRAALPALRDSDRAAVVVTSSIAAVAGIPQRALYSASKGALARTDVGDGGRRGGRRRTSERRRAWNRGHSLGGPVVGLGGRSGS